MRDERRPMRVPGDEEGKPTGIARIGAHTDPGTADPIMDSFLARTLTNPMIELLTLGRDRQSFEVGQEEWILSAGAIRLIELQRESDFKQAPFCNAILLLTGRCDADDSSKDDQLIQMAIDHLDQDVAEGSEALLSYWNAALDGQTGCHSFGFYELRNHTSKAEELAVRGLLETPSNLPADVMKLALWYSAKVLPAAELLSISRARLIDDTDDPTAQRLLSQACFAMDVAHNSLPPSEHTFGADIDSLFDHLVGKHSLQ